MGGLIQFLAVGDIYLLRKMHHSKNALIVFREEKSERTVSFVVEQTAFKSKELQMNGCNGRQ